MLYYPKILVGIFRKMPEREDDHLTPATRLLEKRREMAEVETALAAQKEVDLIFLFFFKLTVALSNFIILA